MEEKQKEKKEEVIKAPEKEKEVISLPKIASLGKVEGETEKRKESREPREEKEREIITVEFSIIFPSPSSPTQKSIEASVSDISSESKLSLLRRDVSRVIDRGVEFKEARFIGKNSTLDERVRDWIGKKVLELIKKQSRKLGEVKLEFEEVKGNKIEEVDRSLKPPSLPKPRLKSFVLPLLNQNLYFAEEGKVRTKKVERRIGIDQRIKREKTEIGEIKGLENSPIEDLFKPETAQKGWGFKEKVERPSILLAEKPEDEKYSYIELLKRLLRELYRIKVKGLPHAFHISRRPNLKREARREAEANKSIYVIDGLTTDAFIEKYGKINRREPIENFEDKFKSYLGDRIREIFSQGYGFLVFYDKKIKEIENKIIKKFAHPAPTKIKLGKKERAWDLAELIWGDVKTEKHSSLDKYVASLEDKYYNRIKAIGNNFKSIISVDPSAKDKEGKERESIIHYGVKSLVVRYLVKREDIDKNKIKTECDIAGGIADILVRNKTEKDLAIEVETLYGTGLPMLKLRERIGSRVDREFRLWVVVPNPQLILYLKEILKLRKYYRRRHGEDIEFYTLNLDEEELISLPRFLKKMKEREEKTRAKP